MDECLLKKLLVAGAAGVAGASVGWLVKKGVGAALGGVSAGVVGYLLAPACQAAELLPGVPADVSLPGTVAKAPVGPAPSLVAPVARPPAPTGLRPTTTAVPSTSGGVSTTGGGLSTMPAKLGVSVQPTTVSAVPKLSFAPVLNLLHGCTGGRVWDSAKSACACPNNMRWNGTNCVFYIR